jgi:hemolysin activation/secretion protein
MTLVLDAQYDSIEGAATINNRGTPEIGRMLLAGRVTVNGVFGTEFAASMYGATSNEPDHYRFVGAGLERNIFSLQSRLDISNSRAELSDGYVYESDRARLQIQFRGRQTQHGQIQPFLAFTWRNAQGRYPDLEVSDVRTRDAELGVVARYSGERSWAYSRAVFSRGINSLGASSFVRDGTAPDLSFAKSELDLSLVRVLGKQWRFRIDAEGQWSNADLPASERFVFGGAVFGRAFDPAELIGDSGGAVSMQIERVQRLQNATLRQASVYLQSDYGYARDHLYGSDEASSITSGLRLAFASMTTTLELSKPLMRPDSNPDASGVRAFAQIQVTF